MMPFDNLRGAYELHVHCAPDHTERPFLSPECHQPISARTQCLKPAFGRLERVMFKDPELSLPRGVVRFPFLTSPAKGGCPESRAAGMLRAPARYPTRRRAREADA